MQSNAIHELYRLEGKIKQTGDEKIIADWRKLQSSDHFYYMCTKHFADGDVHKYFNPYDSPYESYINFMNVLGNLQSRCVRPALVDASKIADGASIDKNGTKQRRLGVRVFPRQNGTNANDSFPLNRNRKIRTRKANPSRAGSRDRWLNKAF